MEDNSLSLEVNLMHVGIFEIVYLPFRIEVRVSVSRCSSWMAKMGFHLNKGRQILKPYIIKGWSGMAKLIPGMAKAILHHPLNETMH